MTYFFDTNILVQLNNYDFKINKQSNEGFWEWIKDLGQQEKVKVPQVVYGEICCRKDELKEWLEENKDTFFVPSEEAARHIPEVLQAYGGNITETELEQMAADPWLIAHARGCEGTVVSNEVPRNTIRANMKIPTVCENLGVRCIRLEKFLWDELKNEEVN